MKMRTDIEFLPIFCLELYVRSIMRSIASSRCLCLHCTHVRSTPYSPRECFFLSFFPSYLPSFLTNVVDTLFQVRVRRRPDCRRRCRLHLLPLLLPASVLCLQDLFDRPALTRPGAPFPRQFVRACDRACLPACLFRTCVRACVRSFDKSVGGSVGGWVCDSFLLATV